ncbi:hypothetical protein ACOME3_006132 [Neoechinorhynchus agilis]
MSRKKELKSESNIIRERDTNILPQNAGSQEEVLINPFECEVIDANRITTSPSLMATETEQIQLLEDNKFNRFTKLLKDILCVNNEEMIAKFKAIAEKSSEKSNLKRTKNKNGKRKKRRKEEIKDEAKFLVTEKSDCDVLDVSNKEKSSLTKIVDRPQTKGLQEDKIVINFTSLLKEILNVNNEEITADIHVENKRSDKTPLPKTSASTLVIQNIEWQETSLKNLANESSDSVDQKKIDPEYVNDFKRFVTLKTIIRDILDVQNPGADDRSSEKISKPKCKFSFPATTEGGVLDKCLKSSGYISEESKGTEPEYLIESVITENRRNISQKSQNTTTTTHKGKLTFTTQFDVRTALAYIPGEMRRSNPRKEASFVSESLHSFDMDITQPIRMSLDEPDDRSSESLKSTINIDKNHAKSHQTLTGILREVIDVNSAEPIEDVLVAVRSKDLFSTDNNSNMHLKDDTETKKTIQTKMETKSSEMSNRKKSDGDEQSDTLSEILREVLRIQNDESIFWTETEADSTDERLSQKQLPNKKIKSMSKATNVTRSQDKPLKKRTFANFSTEMAEICKEIPVQQNIIETKSVVDQKVHHDYKPNVNLKETDHLKDLLIDILKVNNEDAIDSCKNEKCKSPQGPHSSKVPVKSINVTVLSNEPQTKSMTQLSTEIAIEQTDKSAVTMLKESFNEDKDNIELEDVSSFCEGSTDDHHAVKITNHRISAIPISLQIPAPEKHIKLKDKQLSNLIKEVINVNNSTALSFTTHKKQLSDNSFNHEKSITKNEHKVTPISEEIVRTSKSQQGETKNDQ